MDPAGFEPASATVTECRVPITLRALSECLGVIEQVARLLVTILQRVSRNDHSPANRKLPPARLQHVGLVHGGDGQTFHSRQIGADLK